MEAYKRNKHILYSIFIIVYIMSLTTLLKTTTYGQINIVEQPKSQYTRLSGDVVMTVKAKGSGLRYHWYVKKGAKQKFKKISYETSRKIIVRCHDITMNGWKYKCLIKDKNGETKWSKSAKIIITDIGAKYLYQLDISNASGLFLPKVADGYCYVYCNNKKYENHVKASIDIINKSIGRLFVYTPTASIADIIIVGFNNNHLGNNIYLRGFERDIIEQDGYDIAAVTFVQNNYHYLVGTNNSYFKNISDMEIRGVIIHELGHCVGLPHSDDTNDIMYIKCNGTDALSKNDIRLFKKARKNVRRIGILNHTVINGMVDICYKVQE